MLRADLVPLSWVPGQPRLPGPRQVRAIIDYALGHGRQPEMPGSPFLLTHSQHGAALNLRTSLWSMISDRRNDIQGHAGRWRIRPSAFERMPFAATSRPPRDDLPATMLDAGKVSAASRSNERD